MSQPMIRELPVFSCPAPQGITVGVSTRVKAINVLAIACAAIDQTDLERVESLDFLAADAQVLDAVLVLWAAAGNPAEGLLVPAELKEHLTPIEWDFLVTQAAGFALREVAKQAITILEQ